MDAQIFRDASSESESSLGFNRVVYRGERHGYAASHGAAGVVCWGMKEGENPVRRLGADRVGIRPVVGSGSVETQIVGPRNLQVMDEEGRMIFSAGESCM